jgi:hypothetical protein
MEFNRFWSKKWQLGSGRSNSAAARRGFVFILATNTGRKACNKDGSNQTAADSRPSGHPIYPPRHLPTLPQHISRPIPRDAAATASQRSAAQRGGARRGRSLQEWFHVVTSLRTWQRARPAGIGRNCYVHHVLFLPIERRDWSERICNCCW